MMSTYYNSKMTRTCRALAASVALLLASAGALLGAGSLRDDLAARRARVAEKLGAGTMLVLWSAPTRTYSLDVDYPYRQESNLYYLTGIAQEETTLVMLPATATRERRDVLFIKPADPAREHWYGRTLTTADATTRSGVREVMTTAELEPFVEGVLERHEAARVALLAPPAAAGAPPEPPTREAEFAGHVRERFPQAQTLDATPVLSALRVVKTAYEQSILIKCLDISSDAQMAGMRVARPGAFEYEVKAAVEGAYMARGAVSWAYPSIVGSGPNATILHYPDADRQMRAGELLLVDAAANFDYMSGDITRTYPVSGRFTDTQKDIYSIVLEAQDAGAKVAREGSSLAAIHNRTVDVIKAGLLRLGLITDASGDQYKMWYTHGASHFIGIDVHDVGDWTARLEPGMAFTIEPGIYIRESALDALPKTAANAELIARIQPAVRKYADIGVRVEDSFLLEASGPRRLSAAVPRTIDDIETFLRKR